MDFELTYFTLLFSDTAFPNWNFTCIVPVVLLCALCLFFWMYKNGCTKKNIIFHCILFLAVLSVGLFFTENESSRFRQQENQVFKGIVFNAANTVQKLKHSEINGNVPADSPVFSGIQKYFRSLHSDFPFIEKIYTLRRNNNDNKTLERIVSYPDTAANTVITLKPVHEKAFTGGTAGRASVGSRTHFLNLPESGGLPQNKCFLTVSVPLKNNNGETEAILCIDFEEKDFLIRNCFTLLFVSSAALYLCGMWFLAYTKIYRRKFNQQREELTEAQKSSLAAVKAKSDFLANMSHEIRTPMNALLGFSNILAQRIENGCPPEIVEESKGILEIIQKSGQNLLAIVNDILDFSRIEANLLQVESIPLSIKQVIEDVWQMEQSSVAAKNLDFIIRYKEPIPELILGDPIRMRQILLNLISNSVKFTNSGSVIVQCEMLPCKTNLPDNSEHSMSYHQNVPVSALLRIDVIDTGIGIEPASMGKLFKPFTQVDQTSTRQFAGTGLGLSIARRLAQLMDGDITVVSTPNIGSTFTLQLNVFLPDEEQSSDALEKMPRRDTTSSIISGIRHSSKNDTSKLENSADTEKKYPLKNVRILLVEDMLINQIVIATQLREAGARVDIAGNGKLAVEKINQTTDDGFFFDVVLMDMQMPVMDGYEATSLLRSQGYTKPIVAITAHALTGDKEKTIRAGCDNYIAKPVERQILIDMVKKYTR